MVILNREQMKAVDSYSIQKTGIPSVVLMERAALAVAAKVRALSGGRKATVLCVCGSGNNGADGMAAARLLAQDGYPTEVLCLCREGQKGTAEFEIQKNILLQMGVVFRNNVHFDEYDFIIDAILGIGLSRAVSEETAAVIEAMNAASAGNPAVCVVAVDLPSGIHASDGRILGHAVRASHTVTFGCLKLGLVFYPGAAFAGYITVADIGFAQMPLPDDCIYTYSTKDFKRLPARAGDSNKGSCGKVLVAAGSQNMGGAACLSALAAYRSGCGLVRVFTHENNRTSLLNHVPEAVITTYTADAKTAAESLEQLAEACRWADCIVLGPGLSTGAFAEKIVQTVLAERGRAALVLDADALNLLSQRPALQMSLKKSAEQSDAAGIILTPHMGEMARLMQRTAGELKQEPVRYAQALAQTYGGVCILKDAATVVTDGRRTYVNTSGNCGMSTAGAGDVLTGILAGMLSAGFENAQDAAAMAVYMHGLAGDDCRARLGIYGMKALDLAEALPAVLDGKVPPQSRYVFTNSF